MVTNYLKLSQFEVIVTIYFAFSDFINVNTYCQIAYHNYHVNRNKYIMPKMHFFLSDRWFMVIAL